MDNDEADKRVLKVLLEEMSKPFSDAETKVVLEEFKRISTCGFSRTEGFFWNPEFVQKLTPEQRQWLAEHERMHLHYMKDLDPELRKKAEEAIARLERGEL